MPSPRLLDQVRDRLRVKHYGMRTEDTYLQWIRRFIFFHGRKHPREMGGPQVEAFLSLLATDARVAASTQNQALSALLTVRDGKGARDRLTMLPARLAEPLGSHLARVRGLHERDLAEGYGEVHLPFALARKYPKAGRNWIWQYVFPSGSRSVDPADGVVRRHHLDEKIVQRAVAAAARAAGLAKPVSPHVLRHYLPFLTMSSESGERSGSFEESWPRSRFAQAITRHSFLYLQTIEKAEELVSRFVAPWLAVPWGRLRKSLLLHGERCIEIDQMCSCTFDLYARPQSRRARSAEPA